MGPSETGDQVRIVSIVTASGCHLCEMAKDVVAEVGLDHNLEVRLIDLMSEEGKALARVHRMPFPPLVMIDGQVFGHGRLSAKKLRRFLQESYRPVQERL